MQDAHDEAARYLERLRNTIIVPRGFSVAVDEIVFIPEEQAGEQHRMHLALVKSHAPSTPYAALTTTNRIASPSVSHLRQRRGGGGGGGANDNSE